MATALQSPAAVSQTGVPTPIAASPPTSPARRDSRGGNRSDLLPDLTGLARGTASIIEMIAGQALQAISRKIDEGKDALAKAKPGSRYYQERRQELDMWLKSRTEARRVESAAKRVRMKALSAEERQRIADLRDANPDCRGSQIDALLMQVPVDPFDLAGFQLDAAKAEFERVCSRTYSDPDREEAEFGRADKAKDEAHAEYSRLLAERTGHEAEVILRRLGA